MEHAVRVVSWTNACAKSQMVVVLTVEEGGKNVNATMSWAPILPLASTPIPLSNSLARHGLPSMSKYANLPDIVRLGVKIYNCLC